MHSRPIYSNQSYPISKFAGVLARILVVLCLIALTACNTQTPVKEKASTTHVVEVGESSLTPPRATATALPTATPTPHFPVDQGTQVPPATSVIGTDNVKQVGELARWGKGVITDAVYSPDGKTIAVASTTGVFLYTADGLEQTLAINTDSFVRALVFSPTGDGFAAALGDGSVKAWSMDGKLLKTLNENNDDAKVYALAYSPDASLLATAAGGRTINIYKVSDWSTANSYPMDVNANSLVFSPDGHDLFIGTEAGTNMIAVADGKAEELYKGHSIQDLSISKDGKTLASFTEADLYNPTGVVDTWQVESGQKVATIQGVKDFSADIKSITLSSDGKLVAAGWGDYTAKIWDASSGSLQKTFEDLKPKSNHYYYHRFIAVFSPDDSSLLLAGSDVIGIWDVKTGKLLKSSQVQSDYFERIQLSKDGNLLASVEGTNVRLWQVASGQPVEAQEKDIETNGDVALSPDGASLAVGVFDGSARIYPVTEAGLRKSFESKAKNGYYTGAAFSPDGQTLALAASYPGVIELYNVADGSLVRSITIGANLSYVTLTYSPDGQTLAASTARSIRLFRTSDGKSLQVLTEASHLAFSPDGTLIAGGGAYQDVMHVWEMPAGKPVLNLTYPMFYLTGVAFSPDGKLLAAGDSDGTLSFWDVATGDKLRSWKGHSDMVSGLVFTPDGKTLISCSTDGTIRLWGINPDNIVK